MKQVRKGPVAGKTAIELLEDSSSTLIVASPCSCMERFSDRKQDSLFQPIKDKIWHKNDRRRHRIDPAVGPRRSKDIGTNLSLKPGSGQGHFQGSISPVTVALGTDVDGKARYLLHTPNHH